MKKIITKDGSITYFNEKYQEHYHSVTVGAIQEALKKYVEPLNIQKGMKVLDFCFGLGYNSIALLSKCKDVEIVGIEIDKKILDKILKIDKIDGYDDELRIIKDVVRLGFEGKDYENSNLKIKLIIDDIKKAIKKLEDNYFDAILFDPFSPKKEPTLWSLDVFSEMFRVMKADGRLTTYSCARIVRDNMKEAGFKVIDGPILGRKSPGTIAIKE